MRTRSTLAFSWFASFSVGCGILLIVVLLYEINWIRSHQQSGGEILPHASSSPSKDCDKPVYVVYGHDVDSGYLKHVYEMFDTYGFKRGSLESGEWDILWAHDYPFTALKSQLTKLNRRQKVNHFPGTGFITNKLDLAKTKSVYVPKAFEMPREKDALLNYVAQKPEKMFVQKSNDHRGIRIEKIEEMNLKNKEMFVQEFVDNPLLVDGHKFDIGVYTIITSVEPLRVYIYNGDILFRFCPEKYYPFDPKNKNKYVIGDDYLPLWEVLSLKKYFVQGKYSMKLSFDAYMRANGRDPSPLWSRIEDAIGTVVLQKEQSIVRLLRNYPSKRNFFEMIRFDFAVDNDLNVFIMEANMSPNLSSAHFPPNRLIYYQVLFNLFALVGLTEYGQKSLKEDMAVSMKNLMVFPDICSSDKCRSCYSSECKICSQCLSHESIEYLKEAYVEHTRRRDCKRVFPQPIKNMTDDVAMQDYSPDNQILWTWFKGKCLLDQSWCS